MDGWTEYALLDRLPGETSVHGVPAATLLRDALMTKTEGSWESASRYSATTLGLQVLALLDTDEAGMIWAPSRG